MSKQLVATHDKVDPAMVTAEDLVRAIRNDTIDELAFRLGYEGTRHPEYHVACLITLPEDGEVLPFDDPINGVSQERAG